MQIASKACVDQTHSQDTAGCPQDSIEKKRRGVHLDGYGTRVVVIDADSGKFNASGRYATNGHTNSAL